MIPKEFISALGKEKIPYIENISLREYSTFRTGGRGELGVFPKTRDELIFSLSLAKSSGMPFYVIGKGSNILFGDGTLLGIFIFTEGLCRISVEICRIYAEAGASLSSVATRGAECGLTGLEFAKGIPGSVGGALFMNAGAYGGEMSDIVTYSEAFDCDSGELLKITDHGFSYRESIYMKNPSLICLGTELELRCGEPDQIRAKMRELSEKRREKQPLELPSCGSYFKRPRGHFAGKLIEDCGLKGLCVGGAAVSEKHAGFIVNTGGAATADILALEAQVTEAVYKKFGVVLEREVRVIK